MALLKENEQKNSEDYFPGIWDLLLSKVSS